MSDSAVYGAEPSKIKAVAPLKWAEREDGKWTARSPYFFAEVVKRQVDNWRYKLTFIDDPSQGISSKPTFPTSEAARAMAARHIARLESSKPARAMPLELGDDVHLAQFLADAAFKDVIYAEGKFWRYTVTHWKAVPSHELSAEVRKLSGMKYGENSIISISGPRIKSILSVLEDILAQPDFFAASALGINATNGFITFDCDHNPRLILHSPDHRQRTCCPRAGTLSCQAPHLKAPYWQSC
jgi:hypothetical protein